MGSGDAVTNLVPNPPDPTGFFAKHFFNLVVIIRVIRPGIH